MTNQTDGISALLDKLLTAGKQYAAKGQDLAEEKLNIPDQGPERDAMMDGMKKGALASAVLVGLLGTKSGRSLTGTAIKLGGLAALGTFAYKGYKNWQQTGDPLSAEVEDNAVHNLIEVKAEDRSLLILKAMVAAAHADGHVDDQEVQTIRHKLIEMHLSDAMAQEVEEILAAPLSATSLAHQVTDELSASEVYLATRMIINDQSSSQEQGYLKDLTHALGIQPALLDSLEQQIV